MATELRVGGGSWPCLDGHGREPEERIKYLQCAVLGVAARHRGNACRDSGLSDSVVTIEAARASPSAASSSMGSESWWFDRMCENLALCMKNRTVTAA